MPHESNHSEIPTTNPSDIYCQRSKLWDGTKVKCTDAVKSYRGGVQAGKTEWHQKWGSRQQKYNSESCRLIAS